MIIEEKGENTLASFEFAPGKVEKGYANKRLYINLSNNQVEEKGIDPQVKDVFTGGRGYGLWYLWNTIKPTTKWNDPENELLFCAGPLNGLTQYAGTGKLHVVTLSPETGSAMDSNVGGYFAPFLKFSGWDLLEIQGKAENDILIFIDGNEGKVVIEKAEGLESNSYLLIEELTDKYAVDEKDKRNISIISTGMGAQNSNLGMLNVSYYDSNHKKMRIKQAGRGGTGTVFRDKKILAIILKYKGVNANSNNSDNPELIRKFSKRYTEEIMNLDPVQNDMRNKGTVGVFHKMNAGKCLPVHNHKFGSHPDAYKTSIDVWEKRYTKNKTYDSCWLGCTMRCSHAVNDFELSTGPLKGEKVIIDGPEYETTAGFAANCGCFDPDFVLEANFYCDHYGLDTIGTSDTIAFLMECYENNIIDKKITGGLELTFGNTEAVLELIHQIAQKKGLGKVAGLGVRQAKNYLIENYNADEKFLNDIGLEIKGLEVAEYYCKESLAQQGGFGLANKGPQHDENWLIFMDQVLNQIPTFEDKAEAIHYFSLFRTWFSLVGLCKLPWNDVEPSDNKEKYQGIEAAKVPEHVENYCGLFEGVTGKHISSEELILQSQRVHCFQRIFNLKMGFGTREHDRIPYRLMGPVTEEEYKYNEKLYDNILKQTNFDIQGKTINEKISALRKFKENQYEKLCDAVYQKRGWDSNGIPTLETVQRLGIDFPEIIDLINTHKA